MYQLTEKKFYFALCFHIYVAIKEKKPYQNHMLAQSRESPMT